MIDLHELIRVIIVGVQSKRAPPCCPPTPNRGWSSHATWTREWVWVRLRFGERIPKRIWKLNCL